MAMSSYFKNLILDTHLSGVTVSLHTADPGDTGANEVTGGSYAKQAVAFNAASAGATTNTSVEEYPDMPAVTVSHLGFWDGANYLWGSPLDTPRVVAAGNTFRFAAGAIDPSIS